MRFPDVGLILISQPLRMGDVSSVGRFRVRSIMGHTDVSWGHGPQTRERYFLK
jgi:hypothetical protein